MKRTFDLLFALAGLCVTSPLLAAIVVAIKLGDRGPVIFSQTRVGQHGRPFRMHKFRTMVTNAERIGIPLTVGSDPRITRVGHWLRRTKLDELPQLWNVVKGEMSLVGPRPEVPRYVAWYTPEQRRVLDALPGITDPASLVFFEESQILDASADPETIYRKTVMPEKLRANLEYMTSRSVFSDFAVIAKTIWRIVSSIAMRKACIESCR
jgi:lipopolysaccharide/colanic/teichoic acid biosynthesis glycosyltransferase